MKKIILIFIVSLFAVYAKAQYNVQQNIGGDSVLTNVVGAIKGRVIVRAYSDTNSANHEHISQYQGAEIIIGDSIFIRNATATKWNNFGRANNAVTVNFYGKNSTRDSTILLLSDGTRYAARDSIGASYFNSNVGAGYKLAVVNTNNIKTLFGSTYVNLDSTTNTNALTIKFDTTHIHTDVYNDNRYLQNITAYLQPGTNVTLSGTGIITDPYIINSSGGGGGGGTNSNIGSGYRWAVPATNNIKTFFGDTYIHLDSTTNTNALTLTTDTAALALIFKRNKDTVNLINGYTTLYQNSLKQNLVTLTTSGTSGVSTFNQSTGALNIPNYQAAGTYVISVSGTANRITSTGGTTPVIDIASTYVGQTSITTLGTITTGIWNGTPIITTYGGTGLTSYTAGDIPYYSSGTTLSKLGIGTAKQHLVSNGSAPVWQDTTVTVNSISNLDGTLTISPTQGNAVASIALGHPNTWTGTQTFNNVIGMGVGGSATGQIKFYNSTNGNALTLQAGVTSPAYTLTLPTNAGTNGQAIITDGSGNLSFSTIVGTTYSASNLSGTGVGVYKNTTTNNFNFKRIVAGANVTVTDNTDSITIAGIGNQSITWTGSGDVSGTATGTTSITPTLTLATVNSNVGTFGDGTHVAQITVNGKGLTTAVSSVAITFPSAVTSIATTTPITGGTITTTGTIACPTCVVSAASLTSNQLMIGQGSQGSAILGSLGTTTTLLHGNASGIPSFGSVVTNDITDANVTLAKIQNLTTQTLLGRYAGTDGVSQLITIGTGLALNSSTGVLTSTGGITPAALTKTDDANVTLTLGGTPSTALLQATSLTLGWTGVLAVTRGGTGQSTYTDGQLLIGNSSGNTLTKSTLTAGSNITITNGNGSITIADTGSAAKSDTFFVTIAQLRALSSVDLSVRYYTTDVGQEGFWQWNSSSTVTDNTFAVIKATSITTGRFFRVIYNSETNFSYAHPDLTGSTDASADLQAMIDYYTALGGVKITLPTGTFSLSSVHVKSGIVISANQAAKNNFIVTLPVIINPYASATKIFIFDSLSHNAALEHLYINGLASTDTSMTMAVDFNGFENKLYDCNIVDCKGQAVSAGTIGGSRIEQNNFQGFNSTVYLTQFRGGGYTVRYSMVDCYFTGNEVGAGSTYTALKSANKYADGAYFQFIAGDHINDNLFENGDIGAYIEGGEYNTFKGNRWEYNAAEGLVIDNLSQSSFTGDLFCDNSSSSEGTYDHLFLYSGTAGLGFTNPVFTLITNGVFTAKKVRYSISNQRATGGGWLSHHLVAPQFYTAQTISGDMNLNSGYYTFDMTPNNVVITDANGISSSLPIGSANQVLTVVSNVPAWANSATALITANNGLTASTSTNVQLGGTLIKNTTIAATSSYGLLITGNSSYTLESTTADNIAVEAFATANGSGVYSQSNGNGDAIRGAAVGTGVAINGYSYGGIGATFTVLPTSKNTVIPIMQLFRTTQTGYGAVTNGIGESVDFDVEASDSTTYVSNQLISKYTTANAATMVSQFIITGVNGGTLANKFTLSGSGALQLNAYGSGTFTGTPTYTLQVDASGNIIEGSTAGGSGITIGTSTITGGTSGRVLYDNSGVVGEMTTTGTGTQLVLSTAPTMTNPVVGTQSASDNSTKAASTAYVTGAINTALSGVNPAVAVQAATLTNVSGYTYNNGVSGIGATLTQNSAAVVVIDGYTLLLNDRVLFRSQTASPSGSTNGVYVITTLGTGVIPAVFTRALDYDQPSDMNNTGAIPVVNGTLNASTSWLLTSSVATIGTDPLTYTQFSLAPSSIVTLTGTQTLTNKRYTLTTTSYTTSGGTFTPDSDNAQEYIFTAQSGTLTIAADAGTPTQGQGLIFRIKDNGTSQTISWNAQFRGSTDFALPVATTISKTMYVYFVWNVEDSKWDGVGFTNGF